MSPASEGQPREGLLVLFAPVLVATRGRSAPGRGSTRACGSRSPARPRPWLPAGTVPVLVVEVVHHLAHQDDQRRVQAQRLLDRALELGDLAQGLVADLAPVGVDLVELVGRRASSRRGLRSSSISVQAAVPEVVWWPANIIEMNMPGDLVGGVAGRAVLVLERGAGCRTGPRSSASAFSRWR